MPPHQRRAPCPTQPSACDVCRASDGALTTDCPGEEVAPDRQQEVYETALDYTDNRGWHQGPPAGRKLPRFAGSQASRRAQEVDPRSIAAPSIDWRVVDLALDLQRDLARKAIAWALADRACDERSAALARNEAERAAGLEHAKEKEAFLLACRRAEACDDELRQAARRLVSSLEGAETE